MEDRVATITAAAEATGEFARGMVLPAMPDEFRSFPALVVVRRRASLKPATTDRLHYDADGRIELSVLVSRRSGSFAELDRIARAFLKQLAGLDAAFTLEDIDQYEGMMSERDVYACDLTLSHAGPYDL